MNRSSFDRGIASSSRPRPATAARYMEQINPFLRGVQSLGIAATGAVRPAVLLD